MISEVTDHDKKSQVPRGCALTWTMRYQAEFDREGAEAQWRLIKKHHQVSVGPLTGFREWPRGVPLDADVDSGPIVMGIGAAATAFAIRASRTMDDDLLALRLKATANTVSLGMGYDPDLAGASNSLLAEAIRYQGSVQTSFID